MGFIFGFLRYDLLIGFGHSLQDRLDTGLLYLSSHQVFIEDKVGLVKVEDKVQFANLRIQTSGKCLGKLHSGYISKVSIQRLHVSMNYFQGQQFILLLINSHNKVQTSIPKQCVKGSGTQDGRDM